MGFGSFFKKAVSAVSNAASTVVNTASSYVAPKSEVVIPKTPTLVERAKNKLNTYASSDYEKRFVDYASKELDLVGTKYRTIDDAGRAMISRMENILHNHDEKISRDFSRAITSLFVNVDNYTGTARATYDNFRKTLDSYTAQDTLTQPLVQPVVSQSSNVIHAENRFGNNVFKRAVGIAASVAVVASSLSCSTPNTIPKPSKPSVITPSESNTSPSSLDIAINYFRNKKSDDYSNVKSSNEKVMDDYDDPVAPPRPGAPLPPPTKPLTDEEWRISMLRGTLDVYAAKGQDVSECYKPEDVAKAKALDKNNSQPTPIADNIEKKVDDKLLPLPLDYTPPVRSESNISSSNDGALKPVSVVSSDLPPIKPQSEWAPLPPPKVSDDNLESKVFKDWHLEIDGKGRLYRDFIGRSIKRALSDKAFCDDSLFAEARMTYDDLVRDYGTDGVTSMMLEIDRIDGPNELTKDLSIVIAPPRPGKPLPDPSQPIIVDDIPNMPRTNVPLPAPVPAIDLDSIIKPVSIDSYVPKVGAPLPPPVPSRSIVSTLNTDSVSKNLALTNNSMVGRKTSFFGINYTLGSDGEFRDDSGRVNPNIKKFFR